MSVVLDYLSAPLKKYITQSLQFYLSKYIEDVKLEGLGLMGDIVLENLELRRDVLQESLDIPPDFDFSRGFIKELRITLPWTQLRSRPIEVKIDTIEVILTSKTRTSFRSQKKSKDGLLTDGADGQSSRTKSHSSKDKRRRKDNKEDVAKPSGFPWIEKLVKKMIANVSVQIVNVVFKYEAEDIVLSVALRSLRVYSADPARGWLPGFQELQGPYKIFHKVVEAQDLTVCLDRYKAVETPVTPHPPAVTTPKRPPGPGGVMGATHPTTPVSTLKPAPHSTPSGGGDGAVGGGGFSTAAGSVAVLASPTAAAAAGGGGMAAGDETSVLSDDDSSTAPASASTSTPMKRPPPSAPHTEGGAAPRRKIDGYELPLLQRTAITIRARAAMQPHPTPDEFAACGYVISPVHASSSSSKSKPSSRSRSSSSSGGSGSNSGSGPGSIPSGSCARDAFVRTPSLQFDPFSDAVTFGSSSSSTNTSSSSNSRPTPAPRGDGEGEGGEGGGRRLALSSATFGVDLPQTLRGVRGGGQGMGGGRDGWGRPRGGGSLNGSGSWSGSGSGSGGELDVLGAFQGVDFMGVGIANPFSGGPDPASASSHSANSSGGGPHTATPVPGGGGGGGRPD